MDNIENNGERELPAIEDVELVILVGTRERGRHNLLLYHDLTPGYVPSDIRDHGLPRNPLTRRQFEHTAQLVATRTIQQLPTRELQANLLQAQRHAQAVVGERPYEYHIPDAPTVPTMPWVSTSDSQSVPMPLEPEVTVPLSHSNRVPLVFPQPMPVPMQTLSQMARDMSLHQTPFPAVYDQNRRWLAADYVNRGGQQMRSLGDRGERQLQPQPMSAPPSRNIEEMAPIPPWVSMCYII